MKNKPDWADRAALRIDKNDIDFYKKLSKALRRAYKKGYDKRHEEEIDEYADRSDRRFSLLKEFI